jgi:hypothetical protein
VGALKPLRLSLKGFDSNPKPLRLSLKGFLEPLRKSLKGFAALRENP